MGPLKRLGRVLAASIATWTLILATVGWTAHVHTATSPDSVAFRLRSLKSLPGKSRIAHLAPRSRSFARTHVKTNGAPTGFTDLVGDRTPLSADLGLASESASWTPASPWFASQNVSAMFPACASGSRGCDPSIVRETTAAVQAALWASQNPPDCSKARYLVLEKEWPAGIGSALHVHAGMLALAISDNRILVTSPNISWRFDAPELCNHSGAQRRYLECFFLPTTACPLPKDWQNRVFRTAAIDTTAEIIGVPARPVLNFTNAKQGMWSMWNNPALAEHQDKSQHWWQAQLTKFLMRPLDYTLKDIVWPLQQTAFYRTEGVIPRPLAAVFIRAGDKFIEALPMSVDAHFAELAPVAAKMGIKDVYIGSDSHDRIAEAIDKYGSNYTFHFINWSRPESGLAMGDVVKSQGSWRMSELVRLAMADLFITAQADVMVGTLSSNWARLGDEFRRANGKEAVPYLNPETPRARAVSAP